ncbi:DUF58 domain-containing protein [Geosporobacter ferrireducens]|uniref:DUF58 domain-containing protein n=1 Tax=Geosporobacter ferrireducens TaxID=1424294 RepID=A0A1D8GPP6_9FIRM|nr:DUF58 domain-containing protein [Geosporobacter ferrireducens]AOT72892.1 hypothetical protein Gferi_27045 [Geosporobacter ferrireducens]MTI55297.1 DUF58 domain-containing protein [Geosporobacter ferrireducens]
MKITKLFLIALLLGILVIGISIFFRLFIETFIFYNILLLCLTIADYTITPTKKSFEVERIGDRKLSLLEQEKLQVRIYNKSGYEAFIEVMQELPSAFACEEEVLKDKILPYSCKAFIWTIKPNKRGAFMLEDIYIRQRGRLGLIQKDVLLRCDAEYKVYPSLNNLKKYHMMLRKEYFLGNENHITKKKSDGKEFESLRGYVKGDDVRKINWVKSARENKLMVNQYEPENNKHIYILLDTGRTMSYRVNEYSKLDLAINACVFLSDVVCYNKDRSGLLVFNTKVDRFIKPSKGDFHRNQMLESLYHVEGTKLTSNFDEVLFYLSHQEKRRSLICLFTDIHTLQEVYYIEKGIEYITKKHHLLIFLVKDEKLDGAIHLNVKDKKDVFLKGTAYKMMDERKKIIKSLNKKGVTCIECDRENIVYKAVNEYMKAKNREIM